MNGTYITLKQWREQYSGMPTPEWAEFYTTEPNKKVAIKITNEVIKMWVGRTGRR